MIRILPLIIFAATALLTRSNSVAQSAQVYRDRVTPHWFGENDKFWYRNELSGNRSEFILVDAKSGTRQPAFDHARMAKTLREITKSNITGDQLPIRSLQFSDNNSRITLSGNRGKWTVDLESYEVVDAEPRPATEGESNVALFLPARPSTNKGGRTDLRIENKRAEELQILWINHSGQQVSYGKVAPKKTLSLSTFHGHAWLINDGAGRPVAAFEAGPDPTIVTIDPQTKVRPEKPQRPRRATSGGRGTRRSAAGKSPNQRFSVHVRDHNLWLREISEEATPVTTSGTPENTFRRDAQRARLLSMQYDKPDYPADEPDVSWSPSSRYFSAFQTTQVFERRVKYIESDPADSLHPVVRDYPYAKPGDEIPTRSFHLFDAVEKREIPVDQSLMANPFSLRLLRWSRDGERCWLEYNARGHQTIRIIEVTASSGAVRTIVEERSETFIHYSDGGKHVLEWLPDNQFLWASERSGWNHLYLYDANSGELLHPITTGEWNVRRIERVDRANKQIWFYAVGINTEQDPYHEHFCRISFDGKDLQVLTEGDGTHEVTFSPDRRYFLDRFSRVDLPPVTELRRSDDGRRMVLLEEADASELLATGRTLPIRFSAPGRDGKTMIHGIIHHPQDFDPARSYPVVENIYAGPHDHHVPKTFRSRYRHQQQIADQGFVVVQIDGMGTAWRSKSFHDVCFKNLRDSGFPDRIAWMKAATKKYSWMDVGRVGIYGGSAGGQNAMAALLWHGDFYKAAVADCGCHDNRMDKIWWNEQWMGVPGDGSYVKNSNMENAHQLQGHLLLVVGELDRNVDPATTTQVVSRLIKANKDFDFLLIPGAGHGACETPYGSRRRADFFTRWLQPDQKASSSESQAAENSEG